MNSITSIVKMSVLAIAAAGAFGLTGRDLIGEEKKPKDSVPSQQKSSRGHVRNTDDVLPVRNPKAIPVFLDKGLSWLAEAQFENGGWGAGSHSRQDIRDPRAVQIDPATTAFSAMALTRAGNTLKEGPYAQNVSRALMYLLESVEEFPEEGANITAITGTQPQAKLGQNIDVSMCAQFFSRILPHTKHNAKLEKRVANALDKCLRKIGRGQSSDGSWAGGGWAPVLQSAMANSALEMAQAAGRKVDDSVLERSRDYQKSNIDVASGEVKTESAAGVSLYSITSNQRATAREARKAEEIIKDAKSKGLLPKSAPVSADNLLVAGHSKKEAEKLADAYTQNEAGKRLMQDETVLAGFGNNGGEEYLSYMMTSESLVITGGEDWNDWHRKMSQRLEKIQNENGSWTGHHCITGPVFCTAAVVMTLSADRDVQVLVREQEKK